MKILIINGPNLNLILLRNKDHYGEKDLDSIKSLIRQKFPEIETEFFTSNSESEIIKKIQSCDSEFNGLIINPGAFTHTSVGIRDALEICKIPKIEVHLSNLSRRDDFRNVFITTANCDGYISGFKEIGYLSAIFTIKELIRKPY
jgi:3-dehydroquinate dehydratase-2